jgi:hypothetical protein
MNLLWCLSLNEGAIGMRIDSVNGRASSSCILSYIVEEHCRLRRNIPLNLDLSTAMQDLAGLSTIIIQWHPNILDAR